MTFRIADAFTAALDRLTAPEKAAAKQAAFDLQVDPSAPGLQLHRVDRSRDRDFWTARVTRDLRIVLHKRAGDTLLAWVGHHDVSREINGLFFAGDTGQRIFRPSFAWSAEGVEIRGRSRSLKVNYRTSRQIRRRADLLLPPRLVELEGAEEDRTGVQSLFDGLPAEIRAFPTDEAEAAHVAAWLAQAVADGIRPEQIAVLVRSVAEFPRAERAIADAGLDATPLVARAVPGRGHIALATMHTAKGLEFRAVAVRGCDADVLPSAARLSEAADETALAEIFATERHLLYVAGTRARERLLVSGRWPVSAFLDDLVDP